VSYILLVIILPIFGVSILKQGRITWNEYQNHEVALIDGIKLKSKRTLEGILSPKP